MGVVEVRGAEQFRALGRDLRAAGLEGKGLRRELLRNLRAAGRPLTGAAREAALADLPKHGGLNEWVASSKFSVRNRLSGNGVGMQIRGTKKDHQLGSSNDKGEVRHPVHGHRDRTWTVTKVRRGWYTDALKKKAPAVQLAAFAAIQETNRKIEKGV